MKRLWIRISLVITLVVIFGMLLPIAVSIAVRAYRYETESANIQQIEQPYPPPEPPDWAGRDVSPPMFDPARVFPGRFLLGNLTPYLIGFTLISIVVGILLSRSVSAPLSKLADAARSIGRRDLSRRVEVRGSQEIQEVAQAFNEMAADLQQAEILRQNLLADVAHELRTPITVIQGNLQAILDDVYELDKAEIAQLYDQTRQLTHLVDDLRELAQAEARQLPLEMIPVDLSVLASDVAAIYESIAEVQQIQLQTRISKGLPLIQGDRARLMQCLQNLLNNAFRHTPAGGVVTLSVQQQEKILEVSVQDSGSGIAPEHLLHVFDRFYRVDPARARETGGTGLGLAITRAIIQNHGGTISAVSAGEGQGSTFTISLPIE
jgi:signal transduction histidine kinase